MGTQIAHVIFGAMHEARFSSAHEVESERVKARDGDNSAIVAQKAFMVEDRYLQPPIIRPKAARPDDRTHIVAREIEAQAWTFRDGCWVEPL